MPRRMRAIAELYAALVLLAAAAAIAPMLYSYIENHMPRPQPPRPVLVLELNETHVVCYTPMDVNLTYWRAVGSFQCWIVPNLTSSTLQPCPDVVPRGTYILVTPPWLCR